MVFPPGLDNFIKDSGWSHSHVIAFVSTIYILIGIYIILVVLALRNIWVIVYKLKEYKNLPILMFYLFTIIAVILRLIYLTCAFTEMTKFIFDLDVIQVAAKLCVGVVQDWITLELAVRIHYSKGVSDISEAAKKKLRKVRRILFSIMTLIFTTLSVTAIVVSHK